MMLMVGWFDCFEFNKSLSLSEYRIVVSVVKERERKREIDRQRERKRERKRDDRREKCIQTTPTCTYCKHSRHLSYLNANQQDAPALIMKLKKRPLYRWISFITYFSTHEQTLSNVDAYVPVLADT